MVTTGSSSALQRKMEANRESASCAGRSAAGALRLAIARAAADLFDLAASVIGVIQARSDQAALGQYLSDERLLLLLDGPPGLTGALALDRALMAALIQQQTMGRVSATKPEERPYTATDAALVAPLVNATLERAAKLAENPADIRCLSGFEFGARVEDRRSALLALDAETYRVFDLTLELDGGALQGGICLILPEPEPRADAVNDTSETQNSPTLGHAMGVTRADLIAVMSRVSIPLTELSQMKPGDLLPLVQERLDRIELVSIAGEKVAVGRLGQTGGLRALRLNESRPLSQGDRNGFASGLGAKAKVLDDPMTVEGQLVDPDESVPVVETLPHSDTEDDIEGMSPEEAAVEITALAGLDAADLDSLEEPAS